MTLDSLAVAHENGWLHGVAVGVVLGMMLGVMVGLVLGAILHSSRRTAPVSRFPTIKTQEAGWARRN